MGLVNSFDQWQKITVPLDSYLSLKQLNDGQCQWELIEKKHAAPVIADLQRQTSSAICRPSDCTRAWHR